MTALALLRGPGLETSSQCHVDFIRKIVVIRSIFLL